MLEPGLVANAETTYQTRRTEIAVKLAARLHAATNSASAVRSAAKSAKARCEAARAAIGEALESQRRAVVSAADLAMLFDRLVAGEPESCVEAVAVVAERWEDPMATMAAAQTEVARAHQRQRADALRHLDEAADASQQRSRPLPIRLARSGISSLIGGGLLWRGCLWVNQHWPEIAAHLHH